MSIIARCYGGLLGAGQGGGSCAAAPFRTPAAALQWPNGCPAGRLYAYIVRLMVNGHPYSKNIQNCS